MTYFTCFTIPYLFLFSENVTHDEETKFTGSIELNKCHLQEHEPLHHLLSILPQKAQKGLSSLPIEYTCIDVSPEYIALGTSVGLVLLYDRLGQSLQRLNCKVLIFKYIGGELDNVCHYFEFSLALANRIAPQQSIL